METPRKTAHESHKPSVSASVKSLIVKRRKFLIVAAAFCLLGGTLLARSQAATFTAHIEAEAGQKSGAVASGPTAGASGGASVLFGGTSGTTPNPTPTPPSPTPTTPDPTSTEAAKKFGWGDPLPISDEFNYGSPTAPVPVDQSKWGDAGSCFAGHNGNGRRCGKNSRVDGSKLVMTGDSNGDTGWLIQKYETKYGRWEGRTKSYTVGGSGGDYHPLFLIWPTSNRWPADGEYDWLENFKPGEKCIGAFLHYPHPSMPVEQEYRQKCGVDLSQWNNVGFEWSKDHLKGYFNGEEWFSVSGGANSKRSCVQCMPSGHLNIQLDNFTGTGLKQAKFEVDWMRTYAAPK